MKSWWQAFKDYFAPPEPRHPNQDYRDFLEALRKERDASIRSDLERARGTRPTRFTRKLRLIK